MALAFGNFFLGLVLLVERVVGRVARLILWTAFAWSLGVSVLTGYVIGHDILRLLVQFFTSPLALIASGASIAFVIAPLFVTYFLLATAYTDAHHRLRDRSLGRTPNPLGESHRSAPIGRPEVPR